MQVDKKVMKTIYGDSLMELVTKINKLELQKEDIVQIVKLDNQFILLYYGK